MLPVCLCVLSLIVARQRLGEHTLTAKNIPAIIDELLDASFCMRSVSY
jgi:hypothetical protein